MTTGGIEPATYRFVAQHLNHCAAAVPCLNYMNSLIFILSRSQHDALMLGGLPCTYPLVYNFRNTQNSSSFFCITMQYDIKAEN